jgi:hypothetical protein
LETNDIEAHGLAPEVTDEPEEDHVYSTSSRSNTRLDWVSYTKLHITYAITISYIFINAIVILPSGISTKQGVLFLLKVTVVRTEPMFIRIHALGAVLAVLVEESRLKY